MSMQHHRQAHRRSWTLALCGMMTALGTALMLTSGLIPAMTYAAPIFCGLLLLVVLQECSRREAGLVFGATALLVLLMGVDKEAAFFYLIVGAYPLLKWQIERRFHSRWLRFVVKLLYFLITISLMYVILIFLLGMGAILAEFQAVSLWMNIAMTAVLLFCLMMYDWLLLPMSILYVQRIQPKLRKIK